MLHQYRSPYSKMDYSREDRADATFKKFKVLPDNEMDYAKAERCFTGRLTKLRYKIIARYCRRNTFRTHCHHDWDCCGCLCAQHVTHTYKHNQVTITLSQTFNY